MFLTLSLNLSKVLCHYSIIRYSLVCRNFSLRTKSPTFNYCLDLVEKNDHENFLCTLLLPEHIRNYGVTLRAFNVELAAVADQVKDSTIGQMRFQFWEDTIDRIYTGTIPEQPVCQNLAKVIQTGKISKIYLKRLISSRRDYFKKHFKSLQEAEDYGDSSNSPVYLSLLELSDVKSIEADHAASHLGRAQGLNIMLRGVLRNSQNNFVMLPQELLLKHEVTQEDILRNKVNTNMKNLSFEMASLIHQHLEKVDQILKKLKRKTRCIYLPAVPIRCFLKRLRRADFNLFDPELQQKNERLSLMLLYRRLIL